MDSEKVIKALEGLECCRETNCSDCPYNLTGVNTGFICFIDDLLSDTISLIKEQQEIINKYQGEGR